MQKRKHKKSLKRRRGNKQTKGTKLAQIPLDEENKFAYFKTRT
jgi:hypothetical protein